VGFASSGFKFVSIGQGCVVIVKCMFCFTRDRFRSMGLSNGFLYVVLDILRCGIWIK